MKTEVKLHICWLYREGATCREIASELGYSYAYIYQILKECEITMRPRGWRPTTYELIRLSKIGGNFDGHDG